MSILDQLRRKVPHPRELLPLSVLTAALAAVHLAAYWLRFEGQMTANVWQQYWGTLSLAAGIKLLAFAWFRVHCDWRRYVTFGNLVTLVKATSLGLVVAILLRFLIWPNAPFPRSVFILDWLLTIGAVGGLRSLTRFYAEREPLPFLSAGQTPALIVGVGHSAEAVLRAIRRSSEQSHRVVGFIAEKARDLGANIDGVPVVGLLEETCSLAARHGVKQVFISAGELTGRQVRELMADARQTDVDVNVLPCYEQIITGNVDMRPREVSIEDLLRREPVQLDSRGLHHWLDGNTVLVTGSAGSIGSELCRQLLQFQPAKLVLVDQSENGQFFLERELRRQNADCELVTCVADIADATRMEAVFTEHQPVIVFHAAAYKHVPLMEENVGEAIKNIPLATRTVADLADRHGAKSFVMISTDKAVNPTSVMGCCKRVAELYVQALAQHSKCRFVTVRFGNVLDSAGSVVPIFRDQIARGGPLTVTHPEMVRYFMTIPEASQLVIQAGALGNGGEIFVLDMGEPVKIVDLARDMIRLSGLREGLDIDVEFVGMRPGEKLYEELYGDREQYGQTPHPKILVANCAVETLFEVRRGLMDLAELHNAERNAQLAGLKQMVPEYAWQAPQSVPISKAA